MPEEGATPEGGAVVAEKSEDTRVEVKEPRNEDKPLGEAGEKALDAFKQRAKEAEKRAKELETQVSQFEERDKSETEKLTGKLSKAEQRAEKAEAQLLRFEVAKEKEVPAEAVDLLSGSSREELEASADKILALVKSRPENNETPNFDGGPRDVAPEPKSPEEAHNDFAMKLLGRDT